MKQADNIKKMYEQAKIDTRSSADQAILKKMKESFLQERKTEPQKVKPFIWSKFMKSKLTKLAAAVVMIVVVIICSNRSGIDGSGKVFAAAMDKIKQARTFSSNIKMEFSRENGGKFIDEHTWMFKEPDRQRLVRLSGIDDRFNGEVIITNFGEPQELRLSPFEKTATLYDKSSDYVINSDTGLLELRKLDTSLRDQLIAISDGAAKYIGNAELNGKKVRMFQSVGKKWLATVWIEEGSTAPIQIKNEWPGQKRSPVMYTSIQIDGGLPNELFSLEPPEGYQLKKFTDDWPVNKKKMRAKIMYLILQCAGFAEQHDGQYPKNLSELKEIGIKDEVLKIILASPEQPERASVIKYIQPRRDSDWTKEVVMYEAYDTWPDRGIVVGFADGHCELIIDPNLFEKLVEY